MICCNLGSQHTNYICYKTNNKEGRIIQKRSYRLYLSLSIRDNLYEVIKKSRNVRVCVVMKKIQVKIQEITTTKQYTHS